MQQNQRKAISKHSTSDALCVCHQTTSIPQHTHRETQKNDTQKIGYSKYELDDGFGAVKWNRLEF